MTQQGGGRILLYKCNVIIINSLSVILLHIPWNPRVIDIALYFIYNRKNDKYLKNKVFIFKIISNSFWRLDIKVRNPLQLKDSNSIFHEQLKQSQRKRNRRGQPNDIHLNHVWNELIFYSTTVFFPTWTVPLCTAFIVINGHLNQKGKQSYGPHPRKSMVESCERKKLQWSFAVKSNQKQIKNDYIYITNFKWASIARLEG